MTDQATPTPDAAPAADAAPADAAPAPDATPAAAAHADALGVDLTTVEGTGSGGTITKADVQAAADAAPVEPVEDTPIAEGEPDAPADPLSATVTVPVADLITLPAATLQKVSAQLHATEFSGVGDAGKVICPVCKQPPALDPANPRSFEDHTPDCQLGQAIAEIDAAL